MPKTSHLQDFANDLVAKHGCQTPGMVLVAFTNTGNKLPDRGGHDEQIEYVAEAMKQDDRLVEAADGAFIAKPQTA